MDCHRELPSKVSLNCDEIAAVCVAVNVGEVGHILPFTTDNSGVSWVSSFGVNELGLLYHTASSSRLWPSYRLTFPVMEI